MKGIQSFLIAFFSLFFGLTLGSWLAFITIPKMSLVQPLVLTSIAAFILLLMYINRKFNK